MTEEHKLCWSLHTAATLQVRVVQAATCIQYPAGPSQQAPNRQGRAVLAGQHAAAKQPSFCLPMPETRVHSCKLCGQLSWSWSSTSRTT